MPYTNIKLTNETAHHLLHVLRIKPNENIILCDGNSTDYHCTIIEANTKKLFVTCQIITSSPCTTEPSTSIRLYQALPKGDKLDMIIQKCVELGVVEIIPLITTRSISQKPSTAKQDRFQRISESAAGQSMRGIIPKVNEVHTLSTALEHSHQNQLNIVAYENEKHQTLKHLLNIPYPTNVGIWIGPEGGYTQDEIDMLTSAHVKTATLGTRILRTETAAIATIAQIICLSEL